MPMFQARIIRQEVAITEVEGDTLEAAKEKLRVWLENALRVDLRRLKGHEVGVCRHHRDASGARVTGMHKVDDPLRKLVEAWHSGTLRPQREGRECCGRAACARKLPAVYAYSDNLSERTD